MSEHESSQDKPRDIGLKAIREARIERAASKHGRVTGKAWLVGIGIVLSVVFFAWLYRDRSLANQKEELLSKERAALTTIGTEWLPLRDKLEKVTMDAAGPYKGDFVDPELAKWDFRTLPGIYLRLRQADAKDAASIRKAAEESARDSFVGCFLRENNPSAAAIAHGQDAGSGWNDQPWNLRLAYYAARIFSDEWISDVKNAEDEIHLRVFQQQYDKAVGDELALMADVVKRARFFLLVVDEDVPEAVELTPDAGFKAGKVTEQELQQVPHPSRVSIIDLKRDKEMVRLRRVGSATADFHPGLTEGAKDDVQMNGRLTGSIHYPRVQAAVKRQVNNCALAEGILATLKLPEPAPAK